MMSRDARVIAATVEGVIAWEWLVSGANKLLAGVFPQQLAGALQDGIKGNPNGWYVSFLQSVIIPHSVAFGYAIEIGELLIGVALAMGAILLLGPNRHRGDPQYYLALTEMRVAAVAALACALLCVNFHFFMGDGVFPGLDTTKIFDEGISLDTLMPPLSLLVLFVNVQAVTEMRGKSLVGYTRALARRTLALLGREVDAEDAVSAPSGSRSA